LGRPSVVFHPPIEKSPDPEFREITCFCKFVSAFVGTSICWSTSRITCSDTLPRCMADIDISLRTSARDTCIRILPSPDPFGILSRYSYLLVGGKLDWDPVPRGALSRTTHCDHPSLMGVLAGCVICDRYHGDGGYPLCFVAYRQMVSYTIYSILLHTWAHPPSLE
jgi:hypothetical protein